MKMSRSDQCGHVAVRTWSLTTVISSRKGHRAVATKTKDKTRRRVNPFIDAQPGVDEDASNEKEFYDRNDDLDGLIVADDIKV